MLKVRIEGKLDEIDSFIEKLKKIDDIEVLQESDPYKNRGKSVLYRRYIDAEIKDNDNI